MKPRHQRLALIGGGLLCLCVAAAFVLNAFNSNLVFFFSPTQIEAGEAPKSAVFRVGGLVKDGSLQRAGMDVRFVIAALNTFPASFERSRLRR